MNRSNSAFIAAALAASLSVAVSAQTILPLVPVRNSGDAVDSWQLLVGTPFVLNSCGYMFETTPDGEVLLGVQRLASGEVATAILGTFLMVDQRPDLRIVEGILDEAVAGASHLKLQSVSSQVTGILHRPNGEVISMIASKRISRVFSVESGEMVDEVQSCFPLYLGTSLLEVVAIAVIPDTPTVEDDQEPMMVQADLQQIPSPCLWVWCRNVDQYCQDFAQCRLDYEQRIMNAAALRAACLASVQLNWSICMGGCIAPGGGVVPSTLCALVEIGCDVPSGIQLQVCKVAYLGFIFAADLGYSSCRATANRLNGMAVRGSCDCPESWTLFPQQSGFGALSWTDVDCTAAFQRQGLEWPPDGIPGIENPVGPTTP